MRGPVSDNDMCGSSNGKNLATKNIWNGSVGNGNIIGNC
jgi:hypothetical protein